MAAGWRIKRKRSATGRPPRCESAESGKMYMIRLLVVFFLMVLAAIGQTKTVITVWLIPAEPAAPGDIAQGEQIVEQVDRFNRSLAGTRVTVLNTTDPVLKMKLMAWNPAFVVPNASVITGQTRTLRALQSFAAARDVDLHVRFITWDEAFSLITQLNPDKRGNDFPDVVQIGSTWEAQMASRRLLMARPDAGRDRGDWRNVLDIPAAVLPFITDVRVLFYWKRLPSEAPGARELVLNTSSWDAMIDSIRDHSSSGDTIALPAGLTLNVLHDYAPLVWAGGSPFVARGLFGPYIDLTSKQALAIPLLLQRRALVESRPGEPRRLIAFPESSHEEVTRIFVNGGYRVTQEPANFVARWRQDFGQRRQADGRRFWDYAGVAVPPKPFLGGSALVVLKGSPNAPTAFGLADFLAGDPEFTKILAEAGHLPAGRPGKGIDTLARALGDSVPGSPDTERFVETVQKAIDQGVSYPQLAKWPEAVESLPAQEALQLIWRRMGERDPEALRYAARQAEWLINTRINWFYEARNTIFEAGWLLLMMLLIAGVAVGYEYHRRSKERADEERRSLGAQQRALQAQQRVFLQLYLYRAFRHDAAKFLGDNLVGLVTRARVLHLSGEVFESLKMLAEHFTSLLVPHIETLTNQQFNEMSGKPSELRLDRVADLAYDGARYIYKARFLKDPPAVRYCRGNLQDYVVRKLPYAAVVVLEEWFLNAITDFAGHILKEPVIDLKIEGSVLEILTTGAIIPGDIERLNSTEPGEAVPASRQGIPLMRNIVWFGYGSLLSVENVDGARGPDIRLRIDFGSAIGGL